MPRGLDRTDLNKTGISYRNGFPITLPHNFGDPITLPHDFGNGPPQDTPGNSVILPKNFGNIILPAAPPTPVFLSVNPGGGAVAGGTPFTITGMNFVSGASVSIGGNPATGVVVVSSTEITAVSPAGMAQGLEDISIVTPNGSIDTPFAWVYANSYVTDSVDMTLNAAQIIALSTPLQLIAGMAGMIPIVESGFLVYTPGTSPFEDQLINLYVGSGTGANALENYIGVTGLFTQTLPALVFFNPGYQSETNTTPVHTAIPESVLSGSGINLAMPVGTSGGNGTLRVFLEYSFVEA